MAPSAPTARPWLPEAASFEWPRAESKPDEPGFDWVGALTRLGPARILALAGGIALLLGLAYFLSLAFSRGWITNEMRVALGLVIGFGLLPAGALLFDRERPTLGHVVVGVGLATIDLALFASVQYELASPALALVGAAVAAVAAGVVAVRWNSQLVAGMGIAAVLAAPPIVSAPADLVTVGFLGAVLVGVAYVSFRRDWEWLPWLSLALTVPQILVWLAPGGVEPVLVMIVLGAYWILFAASAMLPVVLGAKRDLARQIALLGTVTAFLTVAAWLGLADPWLRGAFIGAVAAGNLAAGLGLVRRRGLNDDLAHAALGLGIALYVVALALLLQGPAVPIAWTVAMVANGWAWARFRLLRAGIVAMALGMLVTLHLLVYEYPLNVWLGHDFAQRPDQLLPYLNVEGAALGVFLAGLGVIFWLSRDVPVRQGIAAGVVLLLAATLPVEAVAVSGRWATPPLLAAGWMSLAVVAFAADRRWNAAWRVDDPRQPLPIAGAAAGFLAIASVGLRYLAIGGFFGYESRPNQLLPYADPEGIALAICLAGLAALFWLSRDAVARQAIAAGVALFVAGTLPIEAGDQTMFVRVPMNALGWTTLAIATLAGDARWHASWRFNSLRQPLPIAGALLGAVALAQLGVGYRLFDVIAPFEQGRVPFANEASVVTLILMAAMWALAATRRETLERLTVVCLSMIVVAVLLRQQLPLDWAVFGWCLIAGGVLFAAPVEWATLREVATRGPERRWHASRLSALVAAGTAGLLLISGAIATLMVIAPPSRLAVQPINAAMGFGPPNAATIACAAMAFGLAVAAWREFQAAGTRSLGVGVLVAVVYGLSVGLVDSFAVRVPDPGALDEVGKQAQVALTILWAVLGLGLLGYGLMRDSVAARGAGLALLGLATIKAFIFDLASLDIAYRVLSLVGLGVLLLAGAYAYQRLRSRSATGSSG